MLTNFRATIYMFNNYRIELHFSSFQIKKNDCQVPAQLPFISSTKGYMYYFCFVVHTGYTVCDLVHDVEAIHHIC